MASFNGKFKIKTALNTKKSKLSFRQNHITTSNFMQLQPIYRKQLIPNDSISVTAESFARLLPIPQPTFGSATVRNRAFFVPYRVLMPHWNEFITNTAGVSNHHLPILPNSEIVDLFFVEGLNTLTTSVASTDPYDFQYYFSGADHYYKLTSRGMLFYKLLRSLGYDFIVPTTSKTTVTDYDYNALPLLAYAKVFIDWYYPSQYYLSNNMIEQLTSVDNLSMDALSLNVILSSVTDSIYNDSYFVSAFDTPNGPLSVNNIDVEVKDTSSNSVVDSNSTSTTPLLTVAENKFSQFAIDVLHKLSDFMKRNQLVGARAVDRYLSRFGVALDSSKTRRSVYIDSRISPLSFGSVDSNAATSDADLGDYAGKGLANVNPFNFRFDTDEYGEFLIIQSIVPDSGYCQGIDRDILYSSAFDFYQPEFDNLGNQAISASELFIPHVGSFANCNKIFSKVFGWTPRYSEYKVAHDRLTGDFSLPRTVGSTLQGWHLNRLFVNESFTNDVDNMVHSLNFVRGDADKNQFNRIFYYTVGDRDMINVVNSFDVTLLTSMKPMYDYYDFDALGQMVDIDTNGSKMN